MKTQPETIDRDFVEFCRKATDSQLEEIIQREYARQGHGDYLSALIAAAERGWNFVKGKRT